ncbi:heme-thiolate peroxidase [Auriculariales sp. MPI-PUGE-AT-0066]|nr:heme-thiolate peroxidase [Auriculariales sp. MPI-PUGE-AT-0066]
MFCHPTALLAALACSIGVYSAVLRSQDYSSLAGMSTRGRIAYERGIKLVGSQPPPPPPTDTGYKLVFDAAHPHRMRRPGDQRGELLAKTSYLPRSGVATPAQIITATVDGFNMDYRVASLVTYGAHLVNGNHLTNLLSIGGFSKLSGPPPDLPAHAGGLSVHGTFEGDASLTRSDDYLGNNHDLNATLFEQVIACEHDGRIWRRNYNVTAAAEFRWIRIQDSIARNPTFDFGNPRFSTAYAESSFPLGFFSNLSEPDFLTGTSASNMRSFFLEEKYPENFHRRGTPFGGGSVIADLQKAHPIPVDFLEGETSTICALYHKFVNRTTDLYPDPSGALRIALNGNLGNFYQAVGSGCTQLFPYS